MRFARAAVPVGLAPAVARVRDRSIDSAYATGWRLVGAAPPGMAAAAFDLAGDIAWRRDGQGVEQLRRNLSRVVGSLPSDEPGGAACLADPAELDQLVRAAMRSYARYWLETFRLAQMPLNSILPAITVEGVEHIHAADAGGKGVILALPHSGNWDVAGIWLMNLGLQLTTVAERLRPEALFDRFVAYREGLGMQIVPLHGGPRPPLDVLGERLRAGGCVCLLADRDLTAGGVQVDFFGAPARMPPGPALLAATTGAPLLPVALYFTEHGWGQWIGAPIELGTGRLRERVVRATQALADQFADRIARHPADWHMLQKVWVSDLSAPPAASGAFPDG